MATREELCAKIHELSNNGRTVDPILSRTNPTIQKDSNSTLRISWQYYIEKPFIHLLLILRKIA